MQPLRFATAGSVDDGKSTLIGRLLYDARAVQEDQLAAVERASQRRGAGELDLSLLTDGLEAEREQGITIDVAYRYFATATRKYIIADSPGHEQYTRNMATGASNADALVLLIDATKSLLAQTRRHLLIAHLLGIRQAVAFVNKMDLAGHSQATFDRLRAEFDAFAAPLGFDTLLEALENLVAGAERAAAGPFRFPVQLVSRPQAVGPVGTTAGAPRGYMGRIESGHLLAGATVAIFPGGRRTHVKQILAHGVERDIALAGDSVTLVLAEDIDITRGDLIADADRPPRELRSVEATLVWLGTEPLRPNGRYLVQQAARRTLARVAEVRSRLDVNTLAHTAPGLSIAMNDIVQARLTLQAPLFVDPYDVVRATGALILIDEATNQTVAAGLVQ